MDNIVHRIKLLEEEISEILSVLLSYDNNECFEKHKQLIAVEKSISELKKSKTPIPDEMRHLKLKLVVEAGDYDKYQKAKINLKNILTKSVSSLVDDHKETQAKKKVPKRKRKKKHKNNLGFRVTLIELINYEILQPNTTFYSILKGKRYDCILLESGELQAKRDGKVLKFDNPSAMAKELTQMNQNGWTFWNVKLQNRDKPLDFFRKEYLKLLNKRNK